MASFGHSNVLIAQAGLVCGLGRNPLQAVLCARAKLGRRRATALPDGGPSVATHRVWDLPEDCVGFDRLRLLASAGLAQLDLSICQSPVPLLLTLPPADRPDNDAEAAESFMKAELEGAGLVLDPERTRLVRGAHASGARLLQQGAWLIQQGEVEAVLVGGVDSAHHPDVLRQLHEQRLQLEEHDPRELITPGEAAGWLLLAREDSAAAAGAGDGAARPLARLCAVRTGDIPAEILAAVAEEREQLEEAERQPHPHKHHRRRLLGPRRLAPGWRAARRSRAQMQAVISRLTRAVQRNRRRPGCYRWQDRDEHPDAPDPTATMRGLLDELQEQWPGVPMEWALSDVGRRREVAGQWRWSARDSLPQSLVQTGLIDQLGDVGAAMAPTLVALVCGYWDAGFAPSRAALVALHSDGAGRGVVLLQETHGPQS